jgi:hypothetical protein
MAIILWALYPLSPWKRLYESARHLLQVILKNFRDQNFLEWLCARADDPEGVPYIERMIDDLNAVMDLLIYRRAREHLGLKPGPWSRPRPSPLQPRRTRSFNDLYFRLEACTLRFAQIERLARRKAQKLKRLLDKSAAISDEPAHSAITAGAFSACLHLLRSNRGRWIGAQRQDGGGSRVGILRACVRIRAPPQQSSTPKDQSPSPCCSPARPRALVLPKLRLSSRSFQLRPAALAHPCGASWRRR